MSIIYTLKITTEYTFNNDHSINFNNIRSTHAYPNQNTSEI